MVAYSFRPRFVPLIIAGLEPGDLLPGMKRQTIRGNGGKRHARPDERVQLYTGMRTASCKKLGDALCSSVSTIMLTFGAVDAVTIGEDTITRAAELDHFAIYDGFGDFADLRAFWAVEHPGIDRFEGVLIRWKPINPELITGGQS